MSKKMYIIKGDGLAVYSYLLWDFVHKHNLKSISDLVGMRLSLSYKVGKRKKLKRLHIHSYSSHPCELCGYHNYINYTLGGKEYDREIF